jgi:hypothetical protein
VNTAQTDMHARTILKTWGLLVDATELLVALLAEYKHLVGASLAGVDPSSVVAILRYLRHEPETSQAEIVGGTGVPQSLASKILNKMAADKRWILESERPDPKTRRNTLRLSPFAMGAFSVFEAACEKHVREYRRAGRNRPRGPQLIPE